MHSDLLVTSWFLWAIRVIGLVLVAASLGVLVGSSRRPADDFGPLGRWPWVIAQGAFLVLAAFSIVAQVLGFSRGLPSWFAMVFGVMIVAAGMQQVAYLLRVVYPSQKRRRTTEAAAGRGGPNHPYPAESAVPGDSENG